MKWPASADLTPKKGYINTLIKLLVSKSVFHGTFMLRQGTGGTRGQRTEGCKFGVSLSQAPLKHFIINERVCDCKRNAVSSENWAHKK